MRNDLTNIEVDLERLARGLAYPPTPALAGRVRLQITSSGATYPAFPGAMRLAATALAALVVALAALVAIAAPARDAVADLFDRIDIFSAEEVSPELPTDIRGESVTLDEAQERLGRRILLPTGPDDTSLRPSTVVYHDFGVGAAQAVTLSFETVGGVPFAILETDGGIGKGLGGGASAQPVASVGEGDAYWLEGLRIVHIYDSRGNLIGESQRRTDGNTLVWVQDGLALRLEGDISRDEAIDIARSVR
jgi:hypothetical protein